VWGGAAKTIQIHEKNIILSSIIRIITILNAHKHTQGLSFVYSKERGKKIIIKGNALGENDYYDKNDCEKLGNSLKVGTVHSQNTRFIFLCIQKRGVKCSIATHTQTNTRGLPFCVSKQKEG